MFPCQDTPSVKTIFKAAVRSPYRALTSGLQISKKEHDDKTVTYYSHQPVPVPSYLITIAAGDIADASIGPRSTLYTEPSFLKACQYEFSADTESFISIAEKLLIPYEWGTYDILVLPKSFPYGGMENPNLTTVTPTLIAGDRSNVDVIAHELSHSWSGNLITNATWQDFWLNEGIHTITQNKTRLDRLPRKENYWTETWE
jgi:leukotriene-A4 hydrolase